MHRATPANSSFRAYSAGGARALISKFDDLKGVQQVAASFMRGEARKGIEHVQQYGFTSVPFDPDPEKDGKPGLGPETIMNFIGGNRAFPSMGPIDDRRHRLKGLKPGDVGMFRGAKDGLQFLLREGGMFMSAQAGKKLHFQIASKADQSGGELGQKPVENDSGQYFEVDENGTTSANKTITDVAETSLTNAVRNGAIQQVAQAFNVGAPSANLRAGDTPTPTEPTAFNILGAAFASSPIPAGTRSTQLATTAFVGAAIDAASGDGGQIGPPGPQGPVGPQGPPGAPITGTVPQIVTGSRGGNDALASLLTGLAAMGLILDQTTA